MVEVNYSPSARLDNHRRERTSPTVHPGVLKDPHLECFVDVAVKRIYVGDSPAEKAKVAQEAAIMKNAGDHPNILKLVDYREEDDHFVLVITERCLCTFEDIFAQRHQDVWRELVAQLGEVWIIR